VVGLHCKPVGLDVVAHNDGLICFRPEWLRERRVVCWENDCGQGDGRKRALEPCKPQELPCARPRGLVFGVSVVQNTTEENKLSGK
jgi:hypothetical protein